MVSVAVHTALASDSSKTVSMLPLLYPYWHQAASVAERLGPADLALLQPYL